MVYTDTYSYMCVCVRVLYVLVAQSCLILCEPMDCSPPGSSVHGDSLGKNTGVGCHALLQRIFLTQGLNPGLLHCRRIILLSEPPREPQNTGVGSLSLLVKYTYSKNDHCKGCGSAALSTPSVLHILTTI